MAWFETQDWDEFQAIREEVLLRFMEIVETQTAGFAFPTQTLHVAAAAHLDQGSPPRQDRAHVDTTPASRS